MDTQTGPHDKKIAIDDLKISVHQSNSDNNIPLDGESDEISQTIETESPKKITTPNRRNDFQNRLINSRRVTNSMHLPSSTLKIAVPPLKKGFITKQGHIVKNWKSRYFVLNFAELSYFEAPSDEPPYGVQKKGTVSLEGSLIEVYDQEGIIKITDSKSLASEAMHQAHTATNNEIGSSNTTNPSSLIIKITDKTERKEWLEMFEHHLQYANGVNYTPNSSSFIHIKFIQSPVESLVRNEYSDVTDPSHTSTYPSEPNQSIPPIPAKKPEKFQGSVLKRGNFFKTWKNRHFVLIDGMLTYYEKPSNDTPYGTGMKGQVSLMGMTIKMVGDHHLHLVATTDSKLNTDSKSSSTSPTSSSSSNGQHSNNNNRELLVMEIKDPLEKEKWFQGFQKHIEYINSSIS